jgi:hypothetical protein
MVMRYVAAFVAAGLLGMILALFVASMDEPRIDPWMLQEQGRKR